MIKSVLYDHIFLT